LLQGFVERAEPQLRMGSAVMLSHYYSRDKNQKAAEEAIVSARVTRVSPTV